MRIVVSAILLISLGWASSEVDAKCDHAAYLFFNRHLNPAWLDSAAILLEEARNAEPANETALYLWSRLHITLGDKSTTRSAKLQNFVRSRRIADTLIALNDENANGHIWWAVARGREGQTRGILNSLFMVPELKRELKRTFELDPAYPTAYDVQGVMYYELPDFAGGDLGRSEEYLRKGIELDPQYTLLRIDLARLYLKQKRWAEAREQLLAVLDTENPNPPADYYEDDRPDALKMLEQIKEP